MIDVRLSDGKVSNFIERESTKYFKEIDSENMYTKKIKNKEIMNL